MHRPRNPLELAAGLTPFEQREADITERAPLVGTAGGTAERDAIFLSHNATEVLGKRVSLGSCGVPGLPGRISHGPEPTNQAQG